jgi:hypothetical protein
MEAKDFRRIALTLEGTEEGSHMGAVDFRVGGRIFATLASMKQGYGNLMLTPEQQAAFVGKEGVAPTCGGRVERGSGFGEDALVVGLVDGDDVVGAEFLFGVGAGALAHFAAAIGAGQNFGGIARRFSYIARFH